MSEIDRIDAREVIDSRGNPTVEVEVHLADGTTARSMVPSGASTGEREALELRDNDKDRYLGKGVLEAVSNVEGTIADEICGMDASRQNVIDESLLELDGTDDKSNLGANAILGVSLAVARAASKTEEVPLHRYFGGCGSRRLPLPFMNVINGGDHADNDLDIQEFMIVPGGAESYSEALRWGVEVFQTLKSLLRDEGFRTTVGDEGGFAPNFDSNTQALDWLQIAIRESGYEQGADVALALDVASSEIYEDGSYRFEGEKREFDSREIIDYYEKLIDEYPIVSIEDGCDENDWEGWSELTERLGSKIQLVGDDLFVTNPSMLREGISENIANSVLVKINQIGTISETIECIETAHKAGYSAMVSHRSGETEDTSIADLAVGLNTGQIKTGSLSRGERTAKYNRILRIEEQLRPQAEYSGFDDL